MQRPPFGSSGSASGVASLAAKPVLPAALAPRGIEQLLRIKGDLRLGLPVILHDAKGVVLAALAETLTEQRFAALSALGRAELVLTRRRAEAISANLPVDAETLRLRVPDGVLLDWISAIAWKEARSAHMNGTPLPDLQSGTSLQGVAVDIAKSAQALPAIVTVALDPQTPPPAGLMRLHSHDAAQALAQMQAQVRVSSANLPMDASSAGHVHVFRPDDGGIEHYAIEIGTPDLARPVTVRLHSACFTGDVLGSLKCDCGPQLRSAMAAMASTGGGVLLYLNQEGRGIGLANKMRAYSLQDQGFDTVEANHRLGFEDDERDFRIGAGLLREMGFGAVRLLTNNPRKVDMLGAHGVEVVERVPLQVEATAENRAYLATKAAKSGHLL